MNPSHMLNHPEVSIIVPFNTWDDWVMDCVAHCNQMTYPQFSIWLLPDNPPDALWQRRLDALGLTHPLLIEPTGSGNPARKRNIAFRIVPTSVFALIDADAFPRKDWLEKAIPLLKDNIRMVTGPNLTPPGDPLRRRVAGHVMASPLGFGPAYIRHRPVPRQTVNEMPTCNMVVRRPNDLLFNEMLDTAEDMVFCEEMRARGYIILYDPEVVVYHHRRNVFLPFFKQFYRYGLYKGKIARMGKGASHRWHGLPALLLIYLMVSGIAWMFPWPGWVIGAFYAPLVVYLVTIGNESVKTAPLLTERLLTMAAFITGHVAYGFGYLKGLFFTPSVKNASS